MAADGGLVGVYDLKTARGTDPKLRYQDYLHGRKAAMLEALAARP
jgi:hypothetical protein